MKKVLCVVLALFLVLAMVAGCGGGAASPEPGNGNGNGEGPENGDMPELKVALMLPGTINDGSWNATAYQGLMLIEEELGATVSFAEMVPQSDNEEIMRGFAEAGFDIIFGHSFAYHETATMMADQYPDVKFVINSTRLSYGDNVAGVETSTEESGFLAGALAALNSESGKIFSLGGLEIPTVMIQFDWFERGAKMINPDIVVESTFIGSGDDAGAARELTAAFIDQGYDMGIVNANQASLGAYEAIRDQDTTKLVGVVANINEALPEHVVGSVAFSYPQAMLFVAERIVAGTFEATAYNVGVDDGGVIFHPNAGVIDPEHERIINDLIDDIIAGRITFED